MFSHLEGVSIDQCQAAASHWWSTRRLYSMDVRDDVSRWSHAVQRYVWIILQQPRLVQRRDVDVIERDKILQTASFIAAERQLSDATMMLSGRGLDSTPLNRSRMAMK